MVNEYDRQAETFLEENKIKVEFNYMGKLKPKWGDRKVNTYSVIFKNREGVKPNREFNLVFHDSIHNTEQRIRKTPKPYNILACISGTYYNEDFNDFCSEYGYDNDSIKAFETWKAVNEEAEKMLSFFSEEELTELRDIN